MREALAPSAVSGAAEVAEIDAAFQTRPPLTFHEALMIEVAAKAQREAVQYREAMATEAEGRNGKATGQHISEALAQDVVTDPDSRQQPTPDPRVEGPRPSRQALTATQLERCVLQRKAAEQRKALRLMEKTKPEVVLGAAEVGDLADATPSVAVQACVLVSIHPPHPWNSG